MSHPPRPIRTFSLLALLAAVLAVIVLLIWMASPSAPMRPGNPTTLSVNAQGASTRLCRFGVNVTGDVTDYDTEALRMGWYVDYRAKANPPAIGAEYGPVIRLTQTGPISYTYNVAGTQLQQVIAGNPGAAWFIGNEPDRPGTSQDNIEPAVYARAYYELYHLIKAQDPSARIVAGNIVQPTPIRLQYLDMVLDSYRALYGAKMPVDIWGIHNFILNEVSCDYDNTNCWGAEVPPGVNANYGEILTVQDNDSMLLFSERIERFRQWMLNRGYTDVAVYLSEYGILMPPHLGFDTTRVNTFMNATFDYLLNAADPTTGFPADDHRLIQKWSWYSTSDDLFNGWLFDPVTKQMTAMGTNYADYTATLSDTIDFQPVSIYSDPLVPFSSGENVTITLKASVANGGNLEDASGPIVVRFYDGDPSGGGMQIGGDQFAALSGCGESSIVSVTWPDIPPGEHQVFVMVDAGEAVTETSELNNLDSQSILVATERLFLPLVSR